MNYTIERPDGLTDEEGKGKIKAEQSFDDKGKISREDVAMTLVHVLAPEVVRNSYFEILAGDQRIHEAIAQMSEA